MKEILIKLREDNRYTQTAMAKLLGISRQAYMKYETGEVEPPVEVIRKLKKIHNVSYEILIDNRIDLISKNETKPVYNIDNNFYPYVDDSVKEKNLYVADPVPAYANSTQTTKQTIQNSSLDEFATMLFSVAATLKKDKKLTTEEKITKFDVYAKLAEAQMDIANGDKGEDAFEVLKKLRKEYE